MIDPPFTSPALEQAFAAFDPPVRATLIDLRARIFATAAKDARIGPLSETLKWGQPSYTTAKTKTATPIRLGLSKQGHVAIFAHCQSGVIAAIAPFAPPDFTVDGNRALHLPDDAQADHPIIAQLIQTALTYRL